MDGTEELAFVKIYFDFSARESDVKWEMEKEMENDGERQTKFNATLIRSNNVF